MGRRSYSYSDFSAAADIKSPNYLKLVIEGKRNLSHEMAKKFAKALKLDKSQCEEFLALVKFCQEDNPVNRVQYLKELSDLRLKQRLQSGKIKREQLDNLPGWVGWIILHMLDQEGAKLDADSIRSLIPRNLSPTALKEALDQLYRLGLLGKSADGTPIKGRNGLPKTEEIPNILVQKLQSDLVYLGMESLFHDSPYDREFGSLTLSLTEKEFEQFKFELRRLRKKWAHDNALKREESKGERVYQLNMQLFPVTEKAKGTKKAGQMTRPALRRLSDRTDNEVSLSQ
jgi:uncharacterized protein (TIGR02147 family)